MKKIIILLCVIFSSQIYAQRSQKPWTNQPNYKNELQKDVKKSLALEHLAKYFEKDNQNNKDVQKQSSFVEGFPFVNGINIAWINFGRDTGVDPFNGSQYHPDLNQFGQAMDFVKNNGGNVMRWWYHTNGSTNPVYDQNQKVAANPSFFHEDVKRILDLAQSKGIKIQICLWSFDMLKDQWGADAAANKKLLTQSVYTNAYINNALLPLVNAVGNHPALYAWEIFNEPEGMTNEYASHWPGFKEKITMQDIQRFVNKTSGAIRRAQPNVKITNGALGFLTNVEDPSNGFWNAYSDANLKSVGGDQDGYLDFYNIHYYNWARSKGSPFHNNYDINKVDKAAVIGEYYPDDLSFGSQGGDNDHNLPTIPSEALGTTLVDNGWHGTLVWSWTDRSSSSERNRMAAIIRNVSASEPLTDEVAFNNAPTTISPQRSYTFTIDYKATTSREVVVEFWSPNSWLGEQAEMVSAGSATQSVTVTLPNEPSPGSGYFYKAYIRPVGTTWREAIHRDRVNDVTVTGSQLIANGTYYLTSTQSNQRMRSRSRENHSAVMRYPRNYNNQRWIFTHLGDNVYTIKNKSTNRYLEVRDARCTNGGNVMTWTSANDNHQKWKVVTNGTTVYALKPMHCQQLALDRDGGRTNANVHVWEFDASNDNQKWKILPYDNREQRIDDLSMSKEVMVTVYPNPATDHIELAGIEKGDAILIHNLQGTIFKDFIAQKNAAVISITDLNSGYYIVAVAGKSKLKFIKR